MQGIAIFFFLFEVLIEQIDRKQYGGALSGGSFEVCKLWYFLAVFLNRKVITLYLGYNACNLSHSSNTYIILTACYIVIAVKSIYICMYV